VALGGNEVSWDVFVSHAREDKATVARPIAERLSALGYKVWLDEYELALGDSLSAKIDEGLAKSRYGIVVLSVAFFSKRWPQRELDGLVTREILGEKVILPFWHGVDHDFVARFSPTLGGKLAADTSQGIVAVVAQIEQVLSKSPKPKDAIHARDAPVQPVRARRKRRLSLLTIVLAVLVVTGAGYYAIVSFRSSSVSETSWKGTAQNGSEHHNVIMTFHETGQHRPAPQAEIKFFDADPIQPRFIRAGEDNLCKWQQDGPDVTVSCPPDRPFPRMVAALHVTGRFSPDLKGTFQIWCEAGNCPPGGVNTWEIQMHRANFTGYMTHESQQQ
jgi:hypothetical protein